MDKSSAHIRLLQAIDYLKDNGLARKHEDIAEAAKISRPNISAAIKGNPRYITEGNLRKFAAAYSDYINEDWLLTGEGEMAVPDKNLRPHFEAKAAAGFMGGVSEGEYGNDMCPMIPFFSDYDFTIEVQGESMLPDYKEGDVLACRIAKDRLNPPIGKVCVIDSKEGAAVKEIADVTDSAVVCHSFNPDPKYKDYEIEFDNINQIAVVVGTLRPV